MAHSRSPGCDPARVISLLSALGFRISIELTFCEAAAGTPTHNTGSRATPSALAQGASEFPIVVGNILHHAPPDSVPVPKGRDI